ncbi:MAG: AraC family transcriptional regulator [Panacagrimonas sp.]
MNDTDIERLLMPNTYARQLAQEVRDLERLTFGTGLKAEEIEDYAKPITVLQHLHLLRNARSLATSPDWYLRWGQRMGEHFHGPVSAAWLSAPTLGDGFDVFLKYIPSRVPYLHWQGHAKNGNFVAEVSELMDFGPIRAMLVEVPMLVMHEYARTIRPGSIADARIELAYPAPDHAATYARWFQCPVMFGADRNALIFPQVWRDMPNVGFDETLWEAACNRCKTLCGTSDERDTLTLIRQVLFEGLEQVHSDGFAPSLETMAARLHCSPRTLIRRLRSMNTSYHEVVDKVKKQRACELLTNEHLRIHEIADALGYGDAGGFVRSFKRCLGVTPGQYRSQLAPHPVREANVTETSPA